jgi:hypothetical protein
MHKKKKSHKEPTIYTLTDDDIDIINYQVRDVIEEAVEKASQNKKNCTNRCRHS